MVCFLKVTVTGDMRRTRIGRLDNVGDLIPGETNELTSGTVVDVGGVQVGVLYRGRAGSYRPCSTAATIQLEFSRSLPALLQCT